ncbi:MAG: hypothetical protein PHY09_18130 [Desulfuromonadaceae bacterium]|nr:hypothetical protein [Desulfuromonadaceae bacterium]
MSHLLKLPGCSSALSGLSGTPRRGADAETVTTSTAVNNIKAEVVSSLPITGAVAGVAVCALDASKLLMVYINDPGTGVIAVVGTQGVDLQGNRAVTYGSDVTAAYAVSTSRNLIQLIRIGTDKALFVCASGSWIISVTGTVPSFSARVALPGTAPTGILNLLALSDGARAIALWRTSASNNCVVAIDISGATPSFGAVASFTSEISGAPRQTLCLVSDALGVVTYENGTNLYAATVSIANTTTTINTPLVVKTAAYTSFAQGAVVAATSSSSAVVFHRTEDNTIYGAYDVAITGTNLSLAHTTNIPTGAFVPASPYPFGVNSGIISISPVEVYLFYQKSPAVKFARFKYVNGNWVVSGYSAIGTMTWEGYSNTSISFDAFNARICGIAVEQKASDNTHLFGNFYIVEPVTTLL